MTLELTESRKVFGGTAGEQTIVFTPKELHFLRALHLNFEKKRKECLEFRTAAEARNGHTATEVQESVPDTIEADFRGWHLVENSLLVDGEPISASLFDFGIFLIRNRKELPEDKTLPCIHLPKLEHPKEARLWNNVFLLAEDYFDFPIGTIRATVLMGNSEKSQMDEIVFQLKEHSFRSPN